jgi:uncharacterized protein YaaQ
MTMDEDGCYLEGDRESREVDGIIDALEAACRSPQQAVAYTLKMAEQRDRCLNYTASNDPAARAPRTDELEELEPEAGDAI